MDSFVTLLKLVFILAAAEAVSRKKYGWALGLSLMVLS